MCFSCCLQIVINLLPFVHSCLNPIIYGFMSKNFRSRMRCACRSYVCRKSVHCAHMDKRQIAGSDHELDTRSLNGTVHTKISFAHGSISQSDTWRQAACHSWFFCCCCCCCFMFGPMRGSRRSDVATVVPKVRIELSRSRGNYSQERLNYNKRESSRIQ